MCLYPATQQLPYRSTTTKKSTSKPTTTTSSRRSISCADSGLVGTLLGHLDLNPNNNAKYSVEKYLSSQEKTLIQCQCILLSINFGELDVCKAR